MPSKTGESSPTALNRCSCGHYATTHMVVRPVQEGSTGSFLLVPAGGCARCGAQCTHFTPSP